MRKPRFRALLLGSAVLAAAVPLAAWAQSAQPPCQAQAEAPGFVSEVVVTAQRRSERLQDVPLSVTARTGADLIRMGINDTRALSQTVPGLTFTSQGAWAEPNLRGVSTQNSGAGEESPIAIYLDGIYQVSQVASLFQLPDVSQIEVLKGPQGTLFGRNAEGGAILITTKEPSFVASGDVTANFGYYTGSGTSHTSPEYGIRGFLTAPLAGDKLAGSLSFYDDHTDGYLNNLVTGGRDGRINTQIYRAKLLFEPNNSMKFLLAGWYSKTNDNADNAPTAEYGGSDLAAVNNSVTPPVPYYPGAIVPSAPWTTAHEFPTPIITETYGASLRGTFAFDQGTLTSLTAFSHVGNYIRIDVEAGYLPPGPVRTNCYLFYSCIDYVVTQPADSESQEFIWTSKKYDRFNFVAGLFLFRSDERQTQYINQIVPDFVHDEDRVVTKSAALFAEGDYDITPALTFIAGGRVSYETKDGSFAPITPGPLSPTVSPDWTSFTPRASLKYKIDSDDNIYFTFSEGFKSGVINPTPPFVVAAPESLYAYEIGYKRSVSAYSFSSSLFYYNYSNLQVQNYKGIDFETTNAAKATIFGLDGEATVHLSPEFSVRLSGSYLPIAKYDQFDNTLIIGRPLGPTGYPEYVGSVSGDRLLKTPKFEGNLSLNYQKQLAAGLFEASTSVYYTDSFDWELNYLIKTDAHAIVNAELAFTPGESHVRIALWAKNLSNTAYVSGELNGDQVANDAVYGPPREVGVSLGYKF